MSLDWRRVPVVLHSHAEGVECNRRCVEVPPPRDSCTCAGPATPDHEEDCPAAWWNQECVRVSGNILCDVCNRPYWRHPSVTSEAPSLVRACDGRLLKL